MKRTTALIIALLTVLLLLPATTVYGQPTHSISGRVTANGRPVGRAAVTVRIDGRVKRSVTGDDGRYYIGGLPEGTHTVKAAKGSNSASRSVAVPASGAVNFEL